MGRANFSLTFLNSPNILNFFFFWSVLFVFSWFHKAQYRRRSSARKTGNVPAQELLRLYGKPLLQRREHHRPGQAQETTDLQRGERFYNCRNKTLVIWRLPHFISVLLPAEFFLSAQSL